ncbi:MAG: hypothetical protein LBK58_10175 [Prevotellaceae bacterium]|nr:hypothetical protein [Prevotellaceae bacterium]
MKKLFAIAILLVASCFLISCQDEDPVMENESTEYIDKQDGSIDLGSSSQSRHQSNMWK